MVTSPHCIQITIHLITPTEYAPTQQPRQTQCDESPEKFSFKVTLIMKWQRNES